MKFGLISLDFKRFSLEYCFKMARRYGLMGWSCGVDVPMGILRI